VNGKCYNLDEGKKFFKNYDPMLTNPTSSFEDMFDAMKKALEDARTLPKYGIV
jgi:hypothetical protein